VNDLLGFPTSVASFFFVLLLTDWIHLLDTWCLDLKSRV
jgi:hypothetical protein